MVAANTPGWELILPVGTSLFRWLKNTGIDAPIPADWITDGRPIADPVTSPPDPVRVINGLRSHLGPATGELLKTCAEIDSTRQWLNWREDRRSGRNELRHVALLVSDTDSGRWVAQVLKGLLPHALEVAGLDIDSIQLEDVHTSAMKDGLRSFVQNMGQSIRSAENIGRQVAINATPGYKVEAAFATLLGMTLGAEVFYFHEAMRAVVVLPPVPLDWKLESTDLRILARIANEMPGSERAHEIGLGRQLEQLWPFVESVVAESAGESMRIWAPTALGELVLQSRPVVDETIELLPRRKAPEIKFRTGEGGHTPEDAESLANALAERFDFVTRVVFRGWPDGARGTPGVLRPGPDDLENGVVRLRIRSDSNLLLRYELHTTAGNDLRCWQQARDRVAADYGRVTAREELNEDIRRAGEGGTPADSYDDFRELGLLDAMAVKLRLSEVKLHQNEKEMDVYLKERASLVNGRERARRREAEARRGADRATEERDEARNAQKAERKARLDAEARLKAAESALEEARAELAQANAKDNDS